MFMFLQILTVDFSMSSFTLKCIIFLKVLMTVTINALAINYRQDETFHSSNLSELADGASGMEDKMNCLDEEGGIVEDGFQFPPSGDPCKTCHCAHGAMMCVSMQCSRPACQFKPVPGECCEYICLDAGLSNQTNLGVRMIATAISSLLILCLLVFMIHRLRQRQHLISSRRIRRDPSCEDDFNIYMTTIGENGRHSPCDEPPPPYTPRKYSQSSYEEPPPYSAISSTGNGNTGNGSTGNVSTDNGNTGNGNTGNGSTGNGNTGNGSTGNGNTGNGSTGNGNTGNGSTGNDNTGNGNTGNGSTFINTDFCGLDCNGNVGNISDVVESMITDSGKNIIINNNNNNNNNISDINLSNCENNTLAHIHDGINRRHHCDNYDCTGSRYAKRETDAEMCCRDVVMRDNGDVWMQGVTRDNFGRLGRHRYNEVTALGSNVFRCMPNCSETMCLQGKISPHSEVNNNSRDIGSKREMIELKSTSADMKLKDKCGEYFVHNDKVGNNFFRLNDLYMM